MPPDPLTITYIGGPTILLDFGGVRFLTDPTFDPAEAEYTTAPVTLRKLQGPALSSEAIGSFEEVLLSHDHHSDNLDHAGRALLANAKSVFTTTEGAPHVSRKLALFTSPWPPQKRWTLRGPSRAHLSSIHFEDWAHFSEGREDIAHAFASAHLEDRLRWPERGRANQFSREVQ